MSQQTLRQLYSASNGRVAIARAMRAELPNGDQLLAAEAGAFRRLQSFRKNGAPDEMLSRAQATWIKAHAARVAAENEIRRKHGIPERHDEIALPPLE